MAFFIRIVFIITLFRAVYSDMSASEVLDVVSSRINHLSITMTRVSRRQKMIETRLDGLAENMKNSDRSKDIKDNADATKIDMIKEYNILKKAIASEKKYVRSEVGNMHKLIAVLNDKPASKTNSERTPSDFVENIEQERFGTRIQTMERSIATLRRDSNDLETKVFSMKNDIAAVEMKSDDLVNRVDYITTNLSSSVTASERKVSFYVQYRPIGHDSIVMKKRLILFNHIAFNDGSGYNMTSGIFTAPESGVYQFIFFVEAWQVVDDFSCVASAAVVLAVNFRAVADALAEPRHTEQSIQAGNTYINYLKKGQQVWVQTTDNCDQHNIFGYRTSFSGVLLY